MGTGLLCLRPLLPQVSRAGENRRAGLLFLRVPRDERGADSRAFCVKRIVLVLRECVLFLLAFLCLQVVVVFVSR